MLRLRAISIFISHRKLTFNTEALMVEEFTLDEEILRVLGHNPVSSEGIKFDLPVQVKLL